jgi:hypothetical protein
MERTNDRKHLTDSRALKQDAMPVLTIDNAFVERWANAAIERGAFYGEEAEHVRLVVSRLMINLEQTLRPGERFSLDVIEASVQGAVPYYIEKTPHGLVMAADDFPGEE